MILDSNAHCQKGAPQEHVQGLNLLALHHKGHTKLLKVLVSKVLRLSRIYPESTVDPLGKLPLVSPYL